MSFAVGLDDPRSPDEEIDVSHPGDESLWLYGNPKALEEQSQSSFRPRLCERGEVLSGARAPN